MPGLVPAIGGALVGFVAGWWVGMRRLLHLQRTERYVEYVAEAGEGEAAPVTLVLVAKVQLTHPTARRCLLEAANAAGAEQNELWRRGARDYAALVEKVRQYLYQLAAGPSMRV